MVEQPVGERSELPRHLRDLELSGDVAESDAEHLLVLEPAQRAEELLRILGGPRRAPVQLGADPLRRLVQRLRVPGDELVEKLRRPDQLGTEVRALPEQVEQPPRHRRPLVEEPQVAGRHRERRGEVGEVEQRLIGVGAPRGPLQQLERDADGPGPSSSRAAPSTRRRRWTEASAAVPSSKPRRASASVRAASSRSSSRATTSSGSRRQLAASLPSEQDVERLRHVGPMPVELRLERGRVGETERVRQAVSLRPGRRQRLGLPLVHHLQPVLHPPEEGVGLEQPVGVGLRLSSPASTSRRSARWVERTRSAGFRPPWSSCSAAATNSTSRIPPGPSFTSLSRAVLRRSICILRSRSASTAARSSVLRQTNGPSPSSSSLSESDVARDRARLDPRRALPGAALLLVVLEHRRQRAHRRPGTSLRPKVQVHPEAETVLGDRGHGAGQRLGEPRVVGDGGHRPRGASAGHPVARGAPAPGRCPSSS